MTGELTFGVISTWSATAAESDLGSVRVPSGDHSGVAVNKQDSWHPYLKCTQVDGFSSPMM